MRLKIDFGKGGLKGFVAQHAEKAILGLVLALVAFFIYSSATQEVADTGSPEDLKSKASSARSGLNQDYWDAIRPDREKGIEDYRDKAEGGREGIGEKDYALANPWNGRLFPGQGKRGDPQMLPPELVRASGGVYSIPMRTTSRDDPWVDDKDAVVKPKEEATPRRRPKRRKQRRPSSEGSDQDMLSGSGSYYQDAAGGDMGPGYPGYPGADEEGPGGGDPMRSTGMAGARRTIGKTYRWLYDRGHQGTFGQAGRGALGRSLAVVGVTALVPYEKQWEEYERALAESKGYSPKQDIPRYLFFLAERAEVPADPNAPLEWKIVSTSEYAMKISARYAAFPKEIADSAYIVPGVLTMPIPPIMLKPYDGLALHDEIPRQQTRRLPATRQEESPDEEDPIEEIGKPDIASGIPTIPRARAGTLGGGNMYQPGGAGNMYPGGDDPSYDTGSPMDYGDGGSMYADGGSGYDTGAGYGTPYSTATQDQPVVKYKMVRFFDLTAEAGKSYKYRVAVVLEDPNRPRDISASPSKRILDPAVVKRLAEAEAKDEETRIRTGNPTRTFYRQTDWSEPSNVVTIAKPEKFVAGSATRGKVIPLSEGIKVQTTESKGKLVTMVWDERRAAEIPAETEVYRGSFLSFTQDADALHPLTKQIKTIEGYEFGTDAFVADLRGGEELIADVEGKGKDKIETKYYAPGEFLVIDGEGNLLACNEIDDTEEYRRLMFIEDVQQAGAATPGLGMPSDYGSGMMEYGDPSGMDMGGAGGEHSE